MANELQVGPGTDVELRSDADEARELVRLAFGEAAGFFDGLHSIQGSVAERAFKLTGPGGAPAHWMYDRITGAVYGGLKGSVVGAAPFPDGAPARRPPLAGTAVSPAPP